MLRDVVDLRQNRWIPRREENYNPKTIAQIHKEAQLEKLQQQKQRLAAQMQKKSGSGNEMEQALCRMLKKQSQNSPCWRGE